MMMMIKKQLEPFVTRSLSGVGFYSGYESEERDNVHFLRSSFYTIISPAKMAIISSLRLVPGMTENGMGDYYH